MFALIIRRLNKGRTNMLFCAMIVSVLLTAVVDFCSEGVVNVIQFNNDNIWIRYVLDYLYFIVRNTTSPLFVLYLGSLLGLWNHFREKMSVKALWLGPFALQIIVLLSNLFTGKVFGYDADYNYIRGPHIYMIYIVAYLYIIICMSILIVHRDKVTKAKFVMLIALLPINLVSSILQLIVPGLRVDILASTFLMVLIAVGVQRPEEFLDAATDTLSYYSFTTETRKAFDSGSSFRIMILKFKNQDSLRSTMGFALYTKMNRIVADKIRELDGIVKAKTDLFFFNNGVFAASTSSSKSERLLNLSRMVAAFANEPLKVGNMEVSLEPIVCIIRCPEDISNMESLINFINDIDHRIPDSSHVYDLSSVSNTKEFKMLNEMDSIIKRGIIERKFEMYYQPIYSVKEDKFVSAEALIRLKDDEYGFVSPGLFIPVAERTGAIHQIGDYVFTEVCRFISDAVYKPLELEYIEINLSVTQCIEVDLVKKVKKISDAYGIKPEQLMLEITETAVDYDPTITDKNIDELRALGYPFALDDYGTGYSNIKRVVSLPLDIVKLDKSLVDEMDNPQMWVVITSTVNMLKNMNKKILVEGIEDERAAKKFIELGCDYIQGYYYSKPICRDDFVEFITSHNHKTFVGRRYK